MTVAVCLFVNCIQTFAKREPAPFFKSITGVITDAQTKEPLAGASVVVKNTTIGTTTDANGRFTLNVDDGSVTVIVSYASYIQQEIDVRDQSSLQVALSKSVTNLDDVVVIGYGTQKKGDVTSAIASVKSENFVKGAVRDAAQLIQGKVAGLSVSTPSGDPTAGTQIQLRGITTLKASTEPLVLIDGIPGSLNSVAPEDIESIDVLKDGSAAAIYGTRGTNGVILITTRKLHGEARSSLDYNAYVGVQQIARRPDFLTASDYRKYIAEGIKFVDYGGDTDWFKEITRTPVSHTHNLTWQGGTRTTNFTASLNYRNWEGIFLKSDNRQLTGRVDLNHSMLDGKVKFNLNVVSRTQKFWTGGNGNSFNNYVYRMSLIRNPTDSVRTALGAWQERSVLEYDNPVAYLQETDGQSTQNELRLNGNVTVTPIKDLRLKLLVSNVQRNILNGFSQTKQHVSTTKSGLNGFAARSTIATKDDMVELTADYSKTLRDHKFTILVGGSSQTFFTENYAVQNWDFPTDVYSYNRLENGYALGRGEAVMNSSAGTWTLIGFFSRLNYAYRDKYLAMVSVRQEGSSKFGGNNKWGNFPAASFGWRVNKESFMKNVHFVNDLKFRAGYGVTGISPTDNYLPLPGLNYGNRVLVNGVWVQSLAPSRNPNPNLRWERKEEYNFGLDFSLFKNRINGSIDAYRRLTKDMLWDYQVPVPPYAISTITANVGSIQNQGVELILNFNAVQSKDFEWTTSVNFSTNTNKLVSLSNEQFKTTNDFFDEGATGAPIQVSTHRVKIGGPIGDFFGYKSVDIDDQGKWIIEDGTGKRKPIQDAKPEDRQILGNALPDLYAGWNNNIRYKNWDFNLLMRGAFGFQILNFQRMFYENLKVVQYNMLKSAFDNVYGKTRLNTDLAYVSYYVEDGDYWKIDNATLGYTFPTKNSKYIKNARLYVSGLNLLTLTKYKGIDPEVNMMGLSPGNDNANKYPTTRSYTVGVNIGF
ncbi:TonB-dependent receptor [Segetibacter sp. 3557_3]|nr:TonB-dependent receptor [Segetibacter sp. 3557_3]